MTGAKDGAVATVLVVLPDHVGGARSSNSGVVARSSATAAGSGSYRRDGNQDAAELADWRSPAAELSAVAAMSSFPCDKAQARTVFRTSPARVWWHRFLQP